MGKARDLFKKNQRYKANISCKDGHNNRNGMDLIESEDKRWQEYTETIQKRSS